MHNPFKDYTLELTAHQRSITVTEDEPDVIGHDYYSQLDGIRFISIMGVLFQHFLNPRLSHFLMTGNAGVDLFFVISGFLITENLIKLKANHSVQKGLKVFYVRRVLRIFPLYYLYWAILLVFFLPLVADHKWYGIFYLINFYDIYHSLPNLTGHLWSLSVEEQFYVVWPVLIFLAPRKYILTMTFVSVLLACLFMLLNYQHPNQDYNYFHTLSCAVALLTGGVIACLKQFDYKRLLNWIAVSRILSPFALLLFTGISVLYRLGKVQDSELILIRLFICVLGFYWIGKAATQSFKGWFGLFLSNRWVRKIGQMAYGIYMFHYLVYNLVQPVLQNITDKIFQPVIFEETPLKYLKYNVSIIHFPFLVAAVFAVAWVSYTFFESRILKLKRYFT